MAKRTGQLSQTPRKGELFYQPGFGAIAPGKSMTHAPERMGMTIGMYIAAKLNPPPGGDYASAGQGVRKYGVPGIPFPRPGWAGQAGVAQMPNLGHRGSSSRMSGAVQTYGSLGYASMGDGSMDMAIRGARFAGVKKKKPRAKLRRRRI